MKPTAQKASRGRLSQRLTARVSPALDRLAHQYSDPSTTIRIALVLLALKLDADMAQYKDDVRALLAERLEPELVAILHPLYLSLIQAQAEEVAHTPAPPVALRQPNPAVQRFRPSAIGAAEPPSYADGSHAEGRPSDIRELHVGFEV
ncbi:MAG: hypothetical protein HC911_07465 [Chloroflexaceae bacterium]|nr:hypothetical protein [Chloroflexaceae bacterium]